MLTVSMFLQILNDNSGLTLSKKYNVLIHHRMCHSYTKFHTRWHQLALVYSLHVNWHFSECFFCVRLSSDYRTISDAMNQTDEESETLHKQLLDREIDLSAFVQKYKKLRCTYHKRALTYLAAKTSATSWVMVSFWMLYFLLFVKCYATQLCLVILCVFC